MFICFMVVNTIFAMVTALLVYFFLKTSFSVSAIGLRLTAFILSFGILNGLISTIWMEKLNVPRNLQFMKSILLLVICVLCIRIILKANILKSVLSFLIVIICVGFGNAIVPLFFLLLNINISTELASNDIFLFIIVNIMIYAVAALLIYLVSLFKLLGRIKNVKSVGFLLAIALFVMISLGGIHYITDMDFISFLSVFITTFVYLIISIWYIYKFQKYELRIEEQKQQAFYNESLGLVIQDLRRFKHDQANHLTVISAMLKMGKYDQATTYINEIVNTGDHFLDTSLFDIKNAGLFGLISSKKDYAQKQGLKFNVKCTSEIDSIPNVKISELCEVLGIHLDNAIEAALESENKTVEIHLENADSNLTIELTNSYGSIPDIDKIKVDGYSTKGSDRGHGLSIVEKILKNYNSIVNSIDIDIENMKFVQTLQIKKGI